MGQTALWQALLVAALLRIALVVYGLWQDGRLEVPYTDVDYWVFTDAAAALAAGRSPYSRATYRYTPALAAALVPGAWLGTYVGPAASALWGKTLFCCTDLAVGVLLYRLLRLRVPDRTRAVRLVALLWLLNPLVFAISTRGNAEALLALLVVGAVLALQTGRYVWAGTALGLAVHLKLFPVVYAPAVLAHLCFGRLCAGGAARREAPAAVRAFSPTTPLRGRPSSPGLAALASPPRATPSGSVVLGGSTTLGGSMTPAGSATPLRQCVPDTAATATPTSRTPLPATGGQHGKVLAATTPQRPPSPRLVTRWERLRAIAAVGLAAAVAFAVPTAASYCAYGQEYLQHALWYHVVRRDHRHNFSPYFYLFYTAMTSSAPAHRAALPSLAGLSLASALQTLRSEPAALLTAAVSTVSEIGQALVAALRDPARVQYAELVVFVPQFALFLLAGTKFGRYDLPFALFLVTFLFVAFNKVITSQYFVWYLCLLPAAYISLPRISAARWAVIATVWGACQGIWLATAYQLEFAGASVFGALWAASMLFLAGNTWIAGEFIRHRTGPQPLYAAYR